MAQDSTCSPWSGKDTSGSHEHIPLGQENMWLAVRSVKSPSSRNNPGGVLRAARRRWRHPGRCRSVLDWADTDAHGHAGRDQG